MKRGFVKDIIKDTVDYSKICRGVVEDNNDPLKLGRVKVRIWGLHTDKKIKDDYEGIPTEELPWAEPAYSIIEGSVSGYGLWCVPLQGSHVYVFFENGNPMEPRYFASAPGIPTETPDSSKGFSDPDGVYPERLNESDMDENARDKIPHNIVLHTHGGHIIEIDSTPGDRRIRIYHPSGTEDEIDENGNFQEIVVSNKTITISGNWTLNVNNVCDINCSNIQIGNSTLLKLLNSLAGDMYNSHTHICPECGSPTSAPNLQIGNTEKTTHLTAS
jgi:hypothetical protein